LTYLIAFLICAAAAGFEALCAGRDPMAALKATRQPSWSPPTWAWALIGLAWYAICFTALARLVPLRPDSNMPLVLLVLVMLANGAANLFQFRLKRLDLAFFFLFPYWLLLAGFILLAWPLDRVSGVLFSIYAAYQLYAALWAYRLWRLNPSA